MEKIWIRVCSFVLVVVMLCQMLPLQSFAEDVQSALLQDATQQVAEVAPQKEAEDTYIVAEIQENRTEFSKEFLLNNGLHLATVYADAVHYKSEDGWKEIDNTLKLNKEGNYSNTAGVWDVRFPQSLTGEKAVAVTKDGYTLSFRMTGELGGSLQAGKLTTQEMPLKAMNPTVAKPQSIDLTATKAAAEHPETVPEKQHSRLKYERVYEKTDVVYDLIGNQVKESIILESYRSDLQGYRYALDTGSLVPVLEDNGQITLYAPDRKNVIMVMPAPYLLDHAGEYCGDVQVSLTGKGSQYILTYLLPQQWLAEQDRAWPVILDPIVQANISITNIKDQTVSEYKVWNNNDPWLDVGHHESNGKSRAYVKYAQLPELTSSDVVVDAYIQLCKPESGNPAHVYVHKVYSPWEAKGLNWDNAPSYNRSIEDYALVDAAGFYTWRITDIVRDWYANENTGMLFKADDKIEEAHTGRFKRFYSSDHTTESARPILYIAFRNNNGLESYWDYTSTNAGRAGTGHINNFTGNLTWTRDDLGFGGNRMPVSISHTYNLNDAVVPNDNNNSNDTGGNSFGMGTGWRTNFNQLIYRWNLNTDYYIWEDADGTDHYFKKQTHGIYKDEDGMELTLTTTGSGSETFCITDKNGNKSYFDDEGRLTTLSNNQQTKSFITVSYDSSGRLSTVSDGVGRTYRLTYSGGLLTGIGCYRSSSSSTALSHVSYSYSGSNLVSITDTDGKTSQYSYNGSLLQSATDIDGYTVTYSYYNPAHSWQPYRVKTVEESDGSAKGGTLTLAYGHNQTTFTDHNGNKEYHQFNDFGNTTCVLDDEGRAQYAQYAFDTDEEKSRNTDATKKGNQLRVSSDLQYTVTNLMVNNNLRFSSANWFVEEGATKVLTKERCYADLSALRVTTKTGNSGVSSQSFFLPAGQTQTFSCYVSSNAVSVYLQAEANGIVKQSEYQPLDNEWHRLQVSYTNSSNSSCRVTYSVRAVGTGTFHMDCTQLENTPTASRYNLIHNSDFRFVLSENQWTSSGFESNLLVEDGLVEITSSATPQLDENVIKIIGNPEMQKRITQTVYTDGNPGDYYTVCGWAKGNSAPLNNLDENNGREFAIEAVIIYEDESRSDPFVARFNPDCDEWQFAATGIVAEKEFWKIEVSLIYDKNVNTAYFDGIQLYKEGFGAKLEYDENGNVTGVLAPDTKKDRYEYEENELTKQVLSNGSELTYTYDDHHNVKTATTKEGLVYTFTYDPFGNNTSVSVTVDGMTMSASATYSSDGNRMTKTTDIMGKETLYSYNADTNVLDWVQYPEDTEATRTEYSYDAMCRLISAAVTTDTGDSLSAAYSYTDDPLTGIQTASTAYSFTYGDFSLRTGVKIGSRTLASYSYTNDRNRYLSALDYGNGDKVQYEYDDKGRVTKQTYEDGDTVTYSYDNSSRVATVTDSASGITGTQGYDYIDRLALYRETGGENDLTLSYSYYVSNKKLKTLLEVINGHPRGASYIYDAKERLSSYQKADSKRTYTYDKLDRTTQYVDDYDDTDALKTTYTYEGASGRVTAMTVSKCGTTDSWSKTYSYTYDDNGNILTVSDGTNTTSYVYDSQNQLLRENNQAGGFTHVWEYDNAGNILSRTEYAYTTGELGTPTDPVTYAYGVTEWGDLLTSYDGKTVTYDEIGNPLTYGSRTYTWEHGRELASLREYGTTWNFTYNADGLRTKRTDGTNTYSYVYYDGHLQYMGYNGTKVYFTHAPDGTPMGMLTNGTAYFYVTNLQGDVVAITDDEGNIVVEYTYDAWGNILSTTGSLASTIGELNPFRYRGYVYDTETGLYYVSSRYYDPEIGRFINADNYDLLGVNNDFASYNLFAYCGNNPISRRDISGYAWETVWDAVSIAVGVIDVAANPYDPWAWIGLAGDVADLLIPFIGGIGETTRALKAASNATEIADMSSEIKRGWSLGEDITKATKAGNTPSWSTVRNRYWKNKAHYFSDDYSPQNIDRMKKGLAPIFGTGVDMYRMELHHMLGRKDDAFFLFFEITPTGHAMVDPFRYLKKG